MGMTAIQAGRRRVGSGTKSSLLTPVLSTQNFRYPEGAADGARGVWTLVAPHGVPAPECREADFSRDNHLGNGIGGQPNVFNWTVPELPHERCALRIRYVGSGEAGCGHGREGGAEREGWGGEGGVGRRGRDGAWEGGVGAEREGWGMGGRVGAEREGWGGGGKEGSGGKEVRGENSVLVQEWV